MAVRGIRIARIPEAVTEKQLKIYFSNPRHSGGYVTQILYPLVDNSAVIIYEDPVVAARVVKSEHQLNEEDVIVTLLPRQIFNKVVVEVEKAVSMFMNLNYTIVDELEFVGELKVEFDYRKETYSLQGTWYQMEWALHHLDLGMQASQTEGQDKVIVSADTETKVTGQQDLPKTDGKLEPSELLPQSQLHDDQQQQPLQEEEKQQQQGASGYAHVRAGVEYRYSVDRASPELATKEPQQKKNKGLADDVIVLDSSSSDENENTDRGSSDTSDHMISEEQKALMDIIAEGKPDYRTFGDMERRELKRKSETKQDANDEGSPRQKGERDKFSLSMDSRTMSRNPFTDDDTSALVSDSDGTGIGRQKEWRLGTPLRGFSSFTAGRLRYPPRMPEKTSGIDVAQTDFGEAPLTFEFTTETGLKVKVTKDDITKQKTDAIVNATTPSLSNVYGISRAIVKAAGPGLVKECSEYIRKNGQLHYTDVMHTCAGGRLDGHVSFVLHTAGPEWREDEGVSATHQLVCTYLNCLQHTKSLWLHSLATPLISAGAWGFPLDVCIQAFYDAILLHCYQPSRNSHLEEVQLVCFDPDTTMATIMIIRSLFEMDTVQALHAAIERYTTGRSQFNVEVTKYKLPGDGDCTITQNREHSDTGRKDKGAKDEPTVINSRVYERKKDHTKSKDEEIKDLVKKTSIVNYRAIPAECRAAKVKVEKTECDEADGITTTVKKAIDAALRVEEKMVSLDTTGGLAVNDAEHESCHMKIVQPAEKHKRQIYSLQPSDMSHSMDEAVACKTKTAAGQTDGAVKDEVYRKIDEIQVSKKADVRMKESRIDGKTQLTEQGKKSYIDTKLLVENKGVADGNSTPKRNKRIPESPATPNTTQIQETDKNSLSFNLSYFGITDTGDRTEAVSLSEFEDQWSMVPDQTSENTKKEVRPAPEADKEIMFANEYTDSDNELDLQ